VVLARAPLKTGLLALLQLLCALGLALGFVIFSPVSLKLLADDQRKLALLLGGGYLASAMLLLWREHGKKEIGLETLISSLVAGFAPALLFAWHMHANAPARTICAELAWGGTLASLTVGLRNLPRVRAAVIAVCATVSLVVPLVSFSRPHVIAPVRHWRLNSQLYALKITEYRKLIAPSPSTGGAVVSFRDRFLLANGIGDLFLVSRATGGELTARQMLPGIPVNWRDFARTFGHVDEVTSFRTADILVQDLGERVRLFASHHYWKADERCFVVRVSMLEADSARLLNADLRNTAWRTIFESTPCVRIDTKVPLNHFGGIFVGGRMGLLSPNELLLALGDHGHDGIRQPEVFSQDMSASFGKTLLLDLRDFSSSVFSAGHRNPQGLYIDGPDAIWLTEHGPQGGDELNLVRRGANYGWPLVTYGVQYGSHTWPDSTVPGSHEGYTEPFYSWVPSLGVSNLIVMHSQQFSSWEGDLLISSLKNGSLFRARVRESRIVMLERIPFARRIRDLAQGSHGELLLWTDSGTVLEIEPDNEVASGDSVFQMCAGCHTIDDGFSHGIGPDLRKIVNRPVAAAVGYRYSPALTGLGGRWTRERLDQFLANPRSYAPGTRMNFPGIADAQGREELIEFLASGANTNPPPEDPLD
jgi:cytochrome c2